ncbi:hypothetical protein [Vibrio injensis]|uniref:hypothetical protein n=1 Tax=Vibrio injensis TaxID=1307414 RepID=UPI0009327C69|nr:hypothetical protein [Vibrio injensis]
MIGSELNLYGGLIVEEDLPYPFVLYPRNYGTFIGFAREEGAGWVLCACARQSIDVLLGYHRLKGAERLVGRHGAALSLDEFPGKLVAHLELEGAEVLALGLDNFQFVEGVCHLCAKGAPLIVHTPRMYGTELEYRLGWYLRQQQLAWGIVHGPHAFMPRHLPQSLWNLWVTEDELHTGEAYQFLRLRLIEKQVASLEDQDIFKKVKKAVHDEVRARLGIKGVATRLNETLLYYSVCQVFPAEQVLRRARPSWLGRLELDVYVPRLQLAFEYQGQQHYKKVDHWGGDAALSKQKSRDRKKRRLCVEAGVLLVLIKHNEFVSAGLVREKLKALGVQF